MTNAIKSIKTAGETIMLSNEEIGYTIAIVLLILLFTPLIIYRIHIYYQENKMYSKRGNKNYKAWKKQNDIELIKTNYNNTNNQAYYEPVSKYNFLPYRMITPILTQREKTAYYIINEYCINHNLALFSKIRIADFIAPMNTVHNKDFYFWFNKISAKHVDFLIVQQGTFRPLLAIEIDDTTHYRPDRQQRDEFINNIYYSVGLPIYHCWNLQKDTMISEIENTLKSIIQ